MSAGFKAMHDHIPGDQVEFPISEEGMKASKSYSGKSQTYPPLTKHPYWDTVDNRLPYHVLSFLVSLLPTLLGFTMVVNEKIYLEA